MQNRISNYLDTADFPALFSQFSLTDMFDDKEKIRALVTQFIEHKVEEAKRQGAQEAILKLRTEVERQIDNYVLVITKIVDMINHVAREEFKASDPKLGLKVVESRTNFDLYNMAIKLLFIIDADLEAELEFSDLLSRTEKFVLEKEGFLSDIFYINKRNSTLDYDSISQDYPFVRTSKTSG
jgi:hypothetical protein